MADPYAALGVSVTAKPAEIRKAYLKLAKKSHPDLHPGDKVAEERFKAIASAYDIVGDEKKRARFDAGEIDASGAERPPPQPEREFYRQHAEAASGSKYDRQWGSSGAGEDSDPFAELFSTLRQRADVRGDDIHYTFAIDFLDAINGAKKRVTMVDGKTLDITIPPGLKDGQTLRLRGQGQPGRGGAGPGDTLVEIHVETHPMFHRDGTTVRSVLPVTLGEAMAGAKIPVQTVSGVINLTVPKGSNNGAILRIRGKGAPSKDGAGDHLVELKVVLPAHTDDELLRAVTDWEAKHPYDPRQA